MGKEYKVNVLFAHPDIKSVEDLKLLSSLEPFVESFSVIRITEEKCA